MANKMLFIPYLRKGYSRYILEEDNLGKSSSDGMARPLPSSSSALNLMLIKLSAILWAVTLLPRRNLPLQVPVM